MDTGFLYHLICRSFQSPYPPRIFKKYTPIMHNSHRCLLFRRNFQIYLVLIFQVCINFLEKCDTTEWKWKQAGCHQTEDTITGRPVIPRDLPLLGWHETFFQVILVLWNTLRQSLLLLTTTSFFIPSTWKAKCLSTVGWGLLVISGWWVVTEVIGVES